MSYKLKTIALTYSFAQAAAAGSAAFFSTSDLLEETSYKTEAAASIAASFFVLEFINAWSFQGDSILKSEEADDEDHAETFETQYTWPEIFKQTIYLIFDSLKTLTNRYFLLASLNDSGIIKITGPLFWISLASDVLLKKLFDLTNETYEATRSLLSGDTDKKRPLYHNQIEPIQRSRAYEPLLGSPLDQPSFFR